MDIGTEEKNKETKESDEIDEMKESEKVNNVKKLESPNNSNIPKLKSKEVEIVKCRKCNHPLLYKKYDDTYICTQCNLSYKFD